MDEKDKQSNKHLKVGASSISIAADDSMVIAGGIFEAFASGQEGDLRVSAVVIEQGKKICIVSCDVIFLQRDIIDEVCGRIESATGILMGNTLISATHTHHAPTTVTIHGYKREEQFCDSVKEAILEAVIQANDNLQKSHCRFSCVEETTVGQNSRVKLDDGTVLWVPCEGQYSSLEPTGPYDPDMPVLSFMSDDGMQQAVLFNHGSHNIGSLDTKKRSPGFYGLAAQELEKELGGTIVFLSGASGSTHNLKYTPNELVGNVKSAVINGLAFGAEQNIDHIESVKAEFEYKVRYFDEQQEQKAVSYYCHKRRVDWCDNPGDMVEVFRKMRNELAGNQGKIRKSWLQVIAIGDIAFVAVPGEFFGLLAAQIRTRSPFANTYIIGYANDTIGYIPDREAYKLGGYQVWIGFHSFVEEGTGELIVEKALGLLTKLKNR